MLIQIENWINGSVIKEIEADDIKKALEIIVKDRADLRKANLYGANLRGANLEGANLGEWGKLTGNRPFITIGPIGSRQDYLQVFTTENGIFLKTGCFSGNIKAFEKALYKKDSGDKNLHEYHAALALVNTHYELWK